MTLKIEYINIMDLVGYGRNARTHSPEQVDQLVASINEYGFTNPVLIDEDNVLIAGHGRTEAAKKVGLDKVPAVRLSGLSDNQKKALRISDNQLALNAGWDLDLLFAEVSDLRLEDFDLDLLGFDDDFMAELWANDEEEDDDLNEDQTPDTLEEIVSKFGDIWVLGRHRLMCGDSTSINDIEKLMNGEKSDLWITDPPYNVAYEGKTEDALTIQNDSMSDGDFRQFLTDCYSAADAVMKGGASFYIWHADLEGYNFRGAARDIGWQVRQCLIWKKNTIVIGRQDYHWKHEPCLYGWKDGAPHNWYSDRKQSTVLEFDKPQRNGEHPTMKPVELFEYQIENSTKVGDIVLDSFGGSGTTIVACEKLKRKGRSMELDPRYCDVIIRRWQTLTEKAAVLESTGQTFSEIEQAGFNESLLVGNDSK